MLKQLALSPSVRSWLRRGAVACVAIVLVGLSATAGLIASRDYVALEADALERFQSETGTRIRYASRKQSLWPKPRIEFTDIEITRPGEDIAIKAPSGRMSIEVMDLIDGRLDGPALSLQAPEIVLNGFKPKAFLRSPVAMADALDRFSGAFGKSPRFDRMRIAIRQAKVILRESGANKAETLIAPVDFNLTYSGRRERIEMVARHASTTHPVEFSMSLPTQRMLTKGRNLPAAIHISGHESRLTFTGTASRDADFALVGKLDTSIGERLERQFITFSQDNEQRQLSATAISASMTLDRRGIALEALKLERASKELAGIASLRDINGRWSISATLAGDLIDGTGAQAAFQSLKNPDNSWSKKPLVLNPLPNIDLDFRLSTKNFKLGNVNLSNVALSVLTRQGRSEFAVIDSRFGQGFIKARVNVAELGDGQQEVRFQASSDKVDTGKFLDRALGFNRLVGEGNLVIHAEGRGNNVASLISSLSGTAAMEVQSGELVGIDLVRLMARANEPRPELAVVYALAGKTSFESLRANFVVKDGRIEPVGSTFVSPKVTAMLEGVIDLITQRHQMAVILKRRVEEAGQPGEFFAFRIDGGLFSPGLKPDPKLLLNRS